MDDFNLLSNDNVAEYGKEREDRWEGSFPVNDEEGDMVDFQPIGKVSYTSSSFVGVGDYYYFMPSVDKFL